MTDLNRGAPEGETPVNPYSLLEAVNSSSAAAHTAWLLFIAVMIYFMIGVAGITHKAMLLDTPVALPLLQVEIPLVQFFRFAPVILVLLHLGLISQLVLLARKALEFDGAIRLLETSDRRSHPLRLELDNFFFVQGIAGPQRSAIIGGFLHAISWLTLVILPVILLLYIQVAFLPYHDISTTWTHRIALLVDILMLILIGVFLVRAETSFFYALWRTAATHPLSVLATTALLSLVALFSFTAATVPGERLDTVTRALFGPPRPAGSTADARYESGVLMPFVHMGGSGTLFGVFRRYLDVTDTDLVVDKDVTPGEPTLNLRGRDLRYARLDRSDLHQADLTGANLDNASLVGTDLRGVWMHCAGLDALILSDNRQTARCTSARGADFARAVLTEAHLTGIDLTGARLDEARLEAAELSFALLPEASFASARLEKADITGGVQAQGANFLLASLQGADLTGAKLQVADFSSAMLQGAVLDHAQLQGAVLRDAQLDAASLYRANLQGADLTGARITGADLRGAAIWMTAPPQADASGLADLGDLAVRPPDDAEIGALATMLKGIGNEAVRTRLWEALAPLMDQAERKKWANSAQQQAWVTMITAPSPVAVDFVAVGGLSYGARLTDYLAKTMCLGRWSDGAVATGIARRAQRQQFRGDIVVISDKLKAGDCPGSKAALPRVLRDLASAAEAARSN